jgi:hypothetical protein
MVAMQVRGTKRLSANLIEDEKDEDDGGTDKEPDLHPALSGDEVYTPSPRRSEGWYGQLFARCSNRTTSKTSILTLNEQRNLHRSAYT